MVPRTAIVALVVAVFLAGCPQGIDNTDPELPGEKTPSGVTPTPAPQPRQTPTAEEFTWEIARVAGLGLDDGEVQRLVVVLESGTSADALDVQAATILLQHEDESYRFVNERAEDTGAAGTFTLGPPGPESVLVASQNSQRRVLVLDIGTNSTAPLELGRGERAALLVSTPDLTTDTADLVVPQSLHTDVNVQLSGEFAELEREPERERAGRPAIVSATASNITTAGAGVLNITVTKLPGTAPIDYRDVTVQYAGVGEFRTLTYPSEESESDSDTFAVSAVRDADGSVPVLNDDDRLTLTLDLRAAGTDSAGQRLAHGDIALIELTLDTRRTRFLRVRLPENASGETVPLDGVVPKSESYPETRERPTMRIVTSDAQRVANGSALGGVEVDIFKPPTAAPLDPRHLTLDVKTPNGTYTLVHTTANTTGADGHFGIQHRFDLDYSAPVLDDDFDFARLQIDVGADSYESDDGPLGTSVGENITAGSLVTVAATTNKGVSASRGYLVTERE